MTKPHDKNALTKNADKKIVHTRHVSCDGGNAQLGHPKIYMEIKHNETEIICPYCGKEFIFIESQFKS